MPVNLGKCEQRLYSDGMTYPMFCINAIDTVIMEYTLWSLHIKHSRMLGSHNNLTVLNCFFILFWSTNKLFLQVRYRVKYSSKYSKHKAAINWKDNILFKIRLDIFALNEDTKQFTKNYQITIWFPDYLTFSTDRDVPAPFLNGDELIS